VTEANLQYVGSITIDKEILDAVDILPNEKVQIVNNNNGARLETYVIEGEPGSGVICLNGAAARLVQPGDNVIFMSYVLMTDEQAKNYQPRIAIMDENNKIAQMIGAEIHATIL
jgi:aspartate 1-decarboxylase